MAKITIKNDEELNAFADETQTKIELIETEAVKKEDIELIQKDNVELKAALEAAKTQLTDVKELIGVRYKSKTMDEKLNDIGLCLLAIKRNDIEEFHKMGGHINLKPNDNEEWKDDKWNINAAPDMGTPLRGDAATGSYLVPETFASEVLRIPEDPSAMMNQVRTIPMNTRKITFPTKLAGVTFTWVTDETTAKTEKNPTFGYVALECETAAGWIPFSEELDEDSSVALGAYFSELFREAWQGEFDTQALVANGAPFTGILRNAGVNVLNMGAGRTSFPDATLDDLVDLQTKLKTKAKRKGAAYIMHVTVLDHFKKLKDDNGNYVYMAPAGVQPGTLWGYPYVLSDAMPDAASSAVSTPFIVFGNPKHLLYGNRVGMEIRVFKETMDALIYDRLFLRARLRAAFNCGVPAAFSVLKTAAA